MDQGQHILDRAFGQALVELLNRETGIDNEGIALALKLASEQFLNGLNHALELRWRGSYGEFLGYLMTFRTRASTRHTNGLHDFATQNLGCRIQVIRGRLAGLISDELPDGVG